MKVVVSGSTGLIGSALVKALGSGGHTVMRLLRTRGQSEEGALFWDPETGQIDKEKLEGCDAVVHLSGRNVASGRWTEAVKEEIRTSRIKGTSLLSSTVAQLSSPPKVFISASGMGFYGDCGDEVVTEETPAGAGFLAETVGQWEAATQSAAERGVRVVNLRIGIVLSTAGGALAHMLAPFSLGLGGRVGSGSQWWSWIALDDVIGVIEHVLTRDDLVGAINVAAPSPVINEEFTKTLGLVLNRPTLLPMPDFVARAVFGEMADALLLSSIRLQPAKLQSSGYSFKYEKLESDLRHELQKQ